VSFDTYAALLSWLFAARRAGMDFDLSRVGNALHRLGDPQDQFVARVHIAGTNGKGSVAGFTEALVRRAGLRTGVFTSPHLSRFCERFAIDGMPADEALILDAGRRLAAVMVDDERLTFFERATAIALCVFAAAKVEVCVLEVGLGGRLDATNVVAAEVGVVASIARDHEQFLGNTLVDIAREKAGIFKPGQRVVISAANRDDIVSFFVNEAETRGAASVQVAPPCDWPLGMRGDHQRYNAGCALAVADQLEALGVLALAETERKAAVAEASVAGRFETVATAPTIIVDGAHNAHAAQALANALAELYADRRVIAIVAVSEGKDAATILRLLASAADDLIVTRYGQPRAIAPERLAAMASGLVEPVVEADIEVAVARARAMAAADDVIVIAGSLFLVGEARQLIAGVPADPLVVQDPV